MNKVTKLLLKALIPGAITATIGIIKDYLPGSMWGKIVGILIIYAVYILVILVIDFFSNGYLKALFDIWRKGKFRGLWEDKGLIKQVKKEFDSANIIKVKVTRGINLLSTENRFGFESILKDLSENKGNNKNNHVNLKFLLIIPCLNVKHVQNRQKHYNQGDEEFLESWYDFVKRILKYKSKYLEIEVRFYSGSHSRWRFYVFSKNRFDSAVLLSEYGEKDGSKEPMYKILVGPQNIGGYIDTYYDELWDNSITYETLQQQIVSEECINCFPEIGRGQKCKYIKICKKLVNNYKK